MGPDSLETKFLPAERSKQEELLRQRDKIMQVPFMKIFLDGVPDGVIVLNVNRQILLANLALLESRQVGNEMDILGIRPGEAFGCIHSKEHAGCGTTEFCRYCGAAKVLFDCRMGKKAARECRIIGEYESEVEAYDLMVWGTPFVMEGERFILFAIADISHLKRRLFLERIFFHDFLNTSGSLLSFARILDEEAPEELRDVTEPILEAADMLLNEIESQKSLLEAETGELEVNPDKISTRRFLSRLIKMYEQTASAFKGHIRADPSSCEVEINSDPVLLNRVVGNLIKNALEASTAGETVTVACRIDSGHVYFTVANQKVLDEETKHQLFKRSFTTKGPGRGLGLYSVKLITERYLKGKVSFTTSEEEGTVFQIRLPLDQPVD